jgi:dTDP-4-dehydrorhamnose reductase
MAFKNILVTGAHGMLGQDLIPYLQAKGYNVTGFGSHQMSLLETSHSMREKMEPHSPEVIIHGAAYTNVDGAEREPELAMAVNKDGTRNLVLAAQELGAIVMYISTDYVFDGLKGELYHPTDRPHPINIYGWSKYYGELMVSELMEEAYIIRTSWLYGLHKKNFVQWVLESARAGTEIRVAEDWVGSPTWTGNLSVALETLMNSGQFGIHHAADKGVISRYDQAKSICRAVGLSSEHIRPITLNELDLPANRPRYTPLDCPSLAIPSWETGLEAYLTQYHQLYSSPLQ